MKFIIFTTLCSIICNVSFAERKVTKKNQEIDHVVDDTNVKRYDGSFPVLVKSKQAILIDYNTGKVLLEKNADQRMTPSSMTKMMTSYIIEEKLQKKELTLDTSFLIDEEAWKMTGARTFVEPGQMMSVKDILSGIIIQSGNDACIVAAKGIAGGDKQFSILMNKTAKELGLTNTYFKNSHGLSEEGHYSSARDLSRLGAHIIKKHPEYYHLYGEKSFTYNNIKQGNRNPLLYSNIDCDGIKTGHTDAGGYGAVLSCVDQDQRYILVINGLLSMQERADEARRLMSWARQNFEKRIIVKKGEVIEAKAKVTYGLNPTIRLGAQHELSIVALRSDDTAITKNIVLNNPLMAPIKTGDILGKVNIEISGSKHDINLVALDSTEKMGLLKQALSYLKSSLAFLGFDD